MKRIVTAAAVGLVLVLVMSAGAGAPPLKTAQGKVEKVDKSTLTIQPLSGGKVGRSIVLKLTGTSKITTLTTRDTAGKVVLVQRDTEARDLKNGQAIAVVYSSVKDGNVLLSAVVTDADKK